MNVKQVVCAKPKSSTIKHKTFWRKSKTYTRRNFYNKKFEESSKKAA